MSCANVPGERTPPQCLEGPTSRSGSKVYQGPRHDLPSRPTVKMQSLSDREARQALKHMAEFVAAVNLLERAEKEMLRERTKGDPGFIEIKTPDLSKDDAVRLSARGHPVVEVFTLTGSKDRFFKGEPKEPRKWREVDETKVVGEVDKAHSHYYAELIEVKQIDGTSELYLSIPKAAFVRQALFGWKGRPEK